MNTTKEQQKVMSKIREYYNNRRKEIEKISKKKVVECNLINLNLINSCENIRRRNNISYSSQRNNFTNYKLYSKRDKCSNFKSLNVK